tara:strand:+ start:3037 stop:3579 length:543 start_codon:yes stop_codon:yes gene_type:complete
MWELVLKRKTSDCCYRKVSARYKGGNSAYRSGAFGTCDKVGCSNWGESENKSEIEKGKIKDTLDKWFKRRGGKETKDGKTQPGWIACGTCDNKNGPKPCGREDASVGKKRKCKPTCSECDSVKKSPNRKHYTADGKEWTGKTHKMPNGKLMTQDPHNEKSVRLYHKEELPKRRSAFTAGD